MTHSSKLDSLKDIERYLLPNVKSLIIVDLNPNITYDADPKAKL